MEEKNVQLATG